MGSVQLYTAKPLLDRLSSSPAIDPNCCCEPVSKPRIAINVCNFNKWSDSIHDVWLNSFNDPGYKLARPSVHVDGACGGGYYTNATPAPDYCTLGFLCCGKGSYTQTYPAQGCANEDPNANLKLSDPQVCGTYGDCGGDLIFSQIPHDIVNQGTNTVYMAQPTDVPSRINGSYGTLQICKLKLWSGVWIRDGQIKTTDYGTQVVPSFVSVSI